MKAINIVALVLISILLIIYLPLAGITITACKTLMDPDWIVSEINKLDYILLMQDFAANNLDGELAEYQDSIDQIITDSKPWIEQEINETVNDFYSYFKGKTNSLDVTISTAALKKTISENITEILSEEMPDMTQAERDEIIDAIKSEYMNEIEDSYNLSSSTLPAEANMILDKVRLTFYYVNLFNIILMAVSIVFTVLIFLLLGIKNGALTNCYIYLSQGIIGFLCYILIINRIVDISVTNEIPTYLANWIIQVISDMAYVWAVFNVVVGILGIVFLAVWLIKYLHDKKSAESVYI